MLPMLRSGFDLQPQVLCSVRMAKTKRGDQATAWSPGMQQEASFRSTVVGAFESLGREVVLLGRKHLKRDKQPPASDKKNTAGTECCYASRQPGHRGDGEHLLRPTACSTAGASAALTSLPAGVINHIITCADKASRLPMFRTNKLLRDAILGYVAVDGGAQLITCLRIVADIDSHLQQGQHHPSAGKQADRLSSVPGSLGVSAHAAGRLLQLASQSANSLNLHIMGALPQTRIRLETSLATLQHGNEESNAGISSGMSHLANQVTTDWLMNLFQPETDLFSPYGSHLQCLTKIWLQDMALDHPMPKCIGDACPALTTYGLHNVVWPAQEGSIECWQRVQELTLSNISNPQMPYQLSPVSLPSLTSMHLSWSYEYVMSQAILQQEYVTSPGLCARRFCDQLPALTIDGVPWFTLLPDDYAGKAMLGNNTRENAFIRLTYLSITHLSLPVHSTSFDGMMELLVKTTPSLQILHVNSMHLTAGYNHACADWGQMQHLEVDAFATEMFATLACLPRMPKLRMVTVPKGACSKRVEVSTDWVADVIRAMTIPAPEDPESASAVHTSNDMLHASRMQVCLGTCTKAVHRACTRFFCRLSAVARAMMKL